MTFPGLVKANNLSDVVDKEKAWDNLGSNMSATFFETYDPDVLNYINAVLMVDGQPLEPAVIQAINNFVLGCKADGIWNAIKASCILAGARTLAGALVPLVGTAPTNNGFIGIGTDYVRKTGLVGNGASKYLDSNRASSADPQDNCHLSVSIASLSTGNNRTYIGATNTAVTSSSLIRNSFNTTSFEFTHRTISLSTRSRAIGFTGVSRSSSASYDIRTGGSSNTISATSVLLSNNIYVFADNYPPPTPRLHSDGRLAFYSIGESLNLALLDARVTTLINSIAGAIP